MARIGLAQKLPWNRKDSLQDPLQWQPYRVHWKHDVIYAHQVSETYMLHQAMATCAGN